MAADQANDSVATALPWPTADATIVVESASGLDPCFDEESTQTWRQTDQYRTTGCGSTGANIQYRWRFQDGGPWTSFSPDTLYEFFGHPSADAYTVTMEVKDTSTGATEQSSHEFSVSSDLMSMSGPTYVTDKQLKTYQSNHAGRWYERWDPETSYDWNLTLGHYNNYSQYTRIWAAGDYTTLLRVERAASGLGRGRLDVVVCHASIPGCGGPPMEWAMPGGDAADAADVLPLFGGGPWIATMDAMVRFYDLTGGHEQESPFADTAWLDAAETTRATSADARIGLTWSVIEATPNMRKVEFVVDDVTDTYTFGLALDPDVGESPADDRSAYDPDSGALIAFDDTEAVGFILQRDGRNDVSGVKQYGALEFAPRDPNRLRQAVLQPGLALTSQPDDVQFVVSGPEVNGTHTWTLLIARGADPSEVVASLKKIARN